MDFLIYKAQNVQAPFIFIGLEEAIVLSFRYFYPDPALNFSRNEDAYAQPFTDKLFVL
jgi:hypothetical protein